MNVPLTPQQEKLIKQKVKSGEYGSPDEVIDAALRLLEQRDKKLASLRQDIQEGLDSGPSLTGEQVMADLHRKATEQLERH